jgi:hypothetical protein
MRTPCTSIKITVICTECIARPMAQKGYINHLQKTGTTYYVSGTEF